MLTVSVPTWNNGFCHILYVFNIMQQNAMQNCMGVSWKPSIVQLNAIDHPVKHHSIMICFDMEAVKNINANSKPRFVPYFGFITHNPLESNLLHSSNLHHMVLHNWSFSILNFCAPSKTKLDFPNMNFSTFSNFDVKRHLHRCTGCPSKHYKIAARTAFWYWSCTGVSCNVVRRYGVLVLQ